ncbi:MAG TPA: hypothetical protein PLI59_09145 [Candidatus Obscuribacter sp.]|nr:hypothetical protein [Candidatus Melainabacteria bacterium]HNG19332.1 hypothetical protein [Candidatus Obscuribacter sp.]HNG74852.1 hypothetical protein [Candidatus Obscuribacter sp.]
MDKQQILDAYTAFETAREHLRTIIMTENGTCQKGDLKWFALRAQDNITEIVMAISKRVLAGEL